MAYDSDGFGSYGENAAPEGNPAQGLSAGNFGFGMTGRDFAQLGLTAPSFADTGVNFNTSSQVGLQAPSDFAANVGNLGSYGANYSGAADYGFNGNALQGMASLGKANEPGLQSIGYQGLQANPMGAASGYNMAPAAQSVGLQGTQPEKSFFDSSYGKALQALAGFVPVLGGIFNSAVNFSRTQDPISALLGLVPGVGGFLANTAYGLANSRDPLGFLGERAIGTGASMLGGLIGGRSGAIGAGQLAGGFLGNMAADRASIGPFGSASPIGYQGPSFAGMPAGMPEGSYARTDMDTGQRGVSTMTPADMAAMATGGRGGPGSSVSLGLSAPQQTFAQQALAGQGPGFNFGGPGGDNAGLIMRRLATRR